MPKIIVLDHQKLKIHLVTNNEVFSPSSTSRLIAKNIKIQKNDKVLDMGTGTGYLGILCNKLGYEDVVLADIDNNALLLAAHNAELNHCDKLSYIQSDLFGRIDSKNKFDLIIANMPQIPISQELENSIQKKDKGGGINGNETLLRFINDAPNYLNPGGRIYLPVFSISSPAETMAYLNKFNFFYIDSTVLKDNSDPVIIQNSKHIRALADNRRSIINTEKAGFSFNVSLLLLKLKK